MTILGCIRPSILRNKECYYHYMINIHRMRCTVKGDDISSKQPMVSEQVITPDSGDELSEPTTCCMSGCANCVWIEYAEKLSKKFSNSSGDVQKIILEKVTDPNMRAFLLMELRCRNLVK